MRDLIKLDNWSVRMRDQSYIAPEIRRIYLNGIPSRHSHQPERNMENTYITTSHIIDADGRKITTARGTIYLLGKINPDYRKWLKKNSINYNYRQPVTIHEINDEQN